MTALEWLGVLWIAELVIKIVIPGWQIWFWY